MPSLSYAGRMAFIGAVGLSLGGLLGGVAPVALAGSAALTGIAFAWVLTVPLPRRMRRERLEFTWWMPLPPGGVRRPDEPVTLRVALRNPTDEELVLGTARLALSPGLRHTRWKGGRVAVAPRSIATFDLIVRPAHAGRHVLHGAWMTLSGPLGIAWAPLYFPNPLVMEVQPRAYGGSAHARARPTPEKAPALRSGRAERRAGEGPEIRELRDYQHGDPMRRIAWAASARRAKLLVRETEDESQTTRVLIVDASATMRGDDRGASKIDYAIELAAQCARLAASSGDRLGFVAFDRRVVARVDPGDGPAHMRQVVAAAVELRALVDEDLTDVDEDQLLETVARYFREQEGVDVFRDASAADGRHKLARMVAKAIEHDPSARIPVLAKDPLHRLWRSFCRARAIPLPLKHDPDGAAKAAGLALAIRAAIERSREARTLLVVSDLDAIGDFAPVKQSLGLAKQKHHRVTFVAPAGPDFAGKAPAQPAPDERERRDAVVSLFTGEERLRIDEMRQKLASVGVGLYTASPRDPAARWIRRAAAPRAR